MIILTLLRITYKAGDKDLVCYHSAVTLPLHIGVARQRQIS